MVRQRQGKARLAEGWWLGSGGKGRRGRWQSSPTGGIEINPARLAGSISACGPDWQDRNQSSPTGGMHTDYQWWLWVQLGSAGWW